MTNLYTLQISTAPWSASQAGSLEQQFALDGIDMSNVLFNNAKSARDEIVFEVSGSVRFPAILKDGYKLIGDELFDLNKDPGEKVNVADQHQDIVSSLKSLVSEYGEERPPLPDMSKLMTPALPWVYGQKENANVPDWLRAYMEPIRAKQPQSWAEGTTPWPQAPKDGKIIYTGDGR